MAFKSRVMRQKSGNLRSNMYVFRQHGTNDDHPVVVLDNEGDIGKFNRANRSLHHFGENMGGFLVGMVLAGLVYPFHTLVATISFAVGRILHQIGYTQGGYGLTGHAPGFIVASLASAAIEGLLLTVALKGMGMM